MLEIDAGQRRALRAKAHHLDPVVSIGQHGLTPTVLHEIDLALNAHGLIKVRVFNDAREEREALLAEICDGLDCAPVQHLGKLLIFWRPMPEPDEAEPKARAKPAKKPAKRPVQRPAKPMTLGEARAMTRGTKVSRSAVPRRARGQPVATGSSAPTEPASRGNAAKPSGRRPPKGMKTPTRGGSAAPAHDPTIPGARRRRRTTS